MTVRLAAGNWKMHGNRAALAEIAALAAAHPRPAVEILICPPATLLAEAAATARAAGGAVTIGAQDCHHAAAGPHTGDIAAPMLAEAGARAVILGHSERRADHGETSELVRRKAEAAHAAGLVAIICLGETEAERAAGRTLEVVGAQLAASVPDGAGAANTVIAYEPVWAIGSGRIPGAAEIARVHTRLRDALCARFGAAEGAGMRLLYGGSVKPDNAAAVFAIPGVDGALVGGASLRAADFSPIVAALERA
ncbi:MAG: triose-phosphate isomerase [Roseovarius sp.]